MRPLNGPTAVIAQTLHKGSDQNDTRNRKVKYPNKNPVAKKAVKELENGLVRTLGGTVSPVAVSVAATCLNTRLRNRRLSTTQMWTYRDQFSNSQILPVDQKLILTQN